MVDVFISKYYNQIIETILLLWPRNRCGRAYETMISMYILNMNHTGVADNKVEDARQDYTFTFRNTKYVIVMKKQYHIEDAEKFCQKSLNGKVKPVYIR